MIFANIRSECATMGVYDIHMVTLKYGNMHKITALKSHPHFTIGSNAFFIYHSVSHQTVNNILHTNC